MLNNLINSKVLILLIILVIFSQTKIQRMIEDFTNSYNHQCNHGMGKVLGAVAKERGMVSKKKGWDFYFPCGYNYCELESSKLKPENADQKFFLLDGCDKINSKTALWDAIKSRYGRFEAAKIMPNTYLLDNSSEMTEFTNYYSHLKLQNPKCKFVLKNHRQRQEGIKLVNDLKEIKKARNNGFYLVQDYKENPFLISKRKINIRYYLLIVCSKDKIEGYIHNNGFMYYTPKLYKEGTLDFKEHITTGYIDRKVYEENPLTISDFNTHLEGLQPGLSDEFFKRVKNLFHKVMVSLHGKICKMEHLQKNTLFQLFGADIGPDENLEPSLMEINKGPDLSPKDDRDGKVKIKVQGDIMDIVDTDGDYKIKETNGFSLVYSSNK
ncbi:Tubulin-tyrosine ligase family [seawater metagenome]|uniref:Tubulin-tyrosine ligase family n=1 Tax=seawater metagenome TaxID=1561972 RepID=A0A5E8CI21_9ZZZZ